MNSELIFIRPPAYYRGGIRMSGVTPYGWGSLGQFVDGQAGRPAHPGAETCAGNFGGYAEIAVDRINAVRRYYQASGIEAVDVPLRNRTTRPNHEARPTGKRPVHGLKSQIPHPSDMNILNYIPH